MSEAVYTQRSRATFNYRQVPPISRAACKPYFPNGRWQTCGKSGGWNVSGELMVVANGAGPSLVLCPITKDAVSGRVALVT